MTQEELHEIAEILDKRMIRYAETFNSAYLNFGISYDNNTSCFVGYLIPKRINKTQCRLATADLHYVMKRLFRKGRFKPSTIETLYDVDEKDYRCRVTDVVMAPETNEIELHFFFNII